MEMEISMYCHPRYESDYAIPPTPAPTEVHAHAYRTHNYAHFLQTRSTTHRPNAVESPARHVTKQAARNDLRDALYASHKYSDALTMTRVIHSARPLASIMVLIVDFHWEYMTRDQKGEI